MFKLIPERLAIILFNLVPILGVAYYNWAPFEVFWLFWMETLIIAFFNTIRVLYSQGWNKETSQEGRGIHMNIGSAMKYLVMRIFIFLFYSLFIIVFIGVMGARNDNSVRSLSVIFFGSKLFNIALLLTIASQLYYITKYFFLNRAYYFSSPGDYSAIFDGRQIVIHIGVVLGGVGTAFLFKEGQAPGASIWVISVFCITKCILELYLSATTKREIPADV
jgi:hypothetical protein